MADNKTLKKSSAQGLLQDLALCIWSEFICENSPCCLSKPLAQHPCYCICNPPPALLESKEKLLRTIRTCIFKLMHVWYLFCYARSVFIKPGMC